MTEVAANTLNSGAINTFAICGSGLIDVHGAASLACAGTLEGIADRIGLGGATLECAASCDADANKIHGSITTLSGVCSMGLSPTLLIGSTTVAFDGAATLYAYIPGPWDAEAELSGAASMSAVAGIAHASAEAISDAGAATLTASPTRIFASQSLELPGVATMTPLGGILRLASCPFLHLLSRTSPGSDTIHSAVVNGIALNHAYVVEEWSGPYATFEAIADMAIQSAIANLRAYCYLVADPTAIHGTAVLNAQVTASAAMVAAVIMSGTRNNAGVCTLISDAGVVRSDAISSMSCAATLDGQPNFIFDPTLLMEAVGTLTPNATVSSDVTTAILVGSGAIFAGSSIIASTAVLSPIVGSMTANGGLNVFAEAELTGVCTVRGRLTAMETPVAVIEANVYRHPSWRAHNLYRSANSNVVYRDSDDQVVYRYNQSDEV